MGFANLAVMTQTQETAKKHCFVWGSHTVTLHNTRCFLSDPHFCWAEFCFVPWCVFVMGASDFQLRGTWWAQHILHLQHLSQASIFLVFPGLHHRETILSEFWIDHHQNLIHTDQCDRWPCSPDKNVICQYCCKYEQNEHKRFLYT